MKISKEVHEQLLGFQCNEITEFHIYHNLAKTTKSPQNKEILERIATDERRHYDQWHRYTQEHVKPDRLRVWFYTWVARIFGLTFGIKLMEKGEEAAQVSYLDIKHAIPEAEAIAREEDEHEKALINLLDEERLQYVGSIVLGLNDALVELTGALAGFTLALQNTRLIALTGSITGIAAALSMGASEYLSTKAEDTVKHPVKASVYTGTAYVFTVLALIMPYLVLQNYFVCLGCTLITAVLIIAFFNYYISVAKDIPFRSRFLEMAGLSLGVAAFSFMIGFLLRAFLGVEA
jgi:VIT1/CCC1 family predicted Fe2+/Mn2+ transporter